MFKLTTRSELPGEGEAKEFEAGGRTICVARLHGAFTAMDNVCCHRGGPLGQGTIENGKLVCPWHGWQFNLKTGVPLQDAGQKNDIYPLRFEDDEVLVEIP